MDLWGEWERVEGAVGVALHKTGTATSGETLTSIGPGWWKLTADLPFRWAGPASRATLSSHVSTEGVFQHSADIARIFVRTSSWVGFARQAGTPAYPLMTSVMTWYADRERGL